MPDLLLELLTEEIPARMQADAAQHLNTLASKKLTTAGLTFAALDTYVTPRRLVLHVRDLPRTQAATREEKRGPRVGAPPAAIDGFLRSTGLASLDRCETRDSGKGVFYFALIEKAGIATADALPAILRHLITDLPWPKSMRFPAAPFRWVRPLTSVISLFDGAIIPIDLGDVPVGDTTRGHRFLAPDMFTVASFEGYSQSLDRAKVILDRGERRFRIESQISALLEGKALTLQTDHDLLDEVTGLVEWPIVLMGEIEQRFMGLPPELLTTSMRTHQKYFSCQTADSQLAPYFILVANNGTADRGSQIIRGNQRVLRARLSDAQFFWDQDRKQPLHSRVEKLSERIFHAKLGTVRDKVTRVTQLAAFLAPLIAGADAEHAARAAHLAKADLSTGLVGEFPELQGIMGRYLALHDGEVPQVADAIAAHYAPVGASDAVPRQPVAIVTALADKLDTLAGFFVIDEKPTGSKDPFALRRAALGIIRIILENKLRLDLRELLTQAVGQFPSASDAATTIVDQLMEFFADRLKVSLREQGRRFDLVNAVFALGSESDLERLTRRVHHLETFLATENGGNLLTAYRRASRIVHIEERKDDISYADKPDVADFVQSQERALAAALDQAQSSAGIALKNEDYGSVMTAMAELRGPVDAFFDHVTVNVEDGALRRNRLRLLAQLSATLDQVAKFSRIEG